MVLEEGLSEEGLIKKVGRFSSNILVIAAVAAEFRGLYQARFVVASSLVYVFFEPKLVKYSCWSLFVREQEESSRSTSLQKCIERLGWRSSRG